MTKEQRALRRGIRAMQTEAKKEMRNLLKNKDISIDTQAFNALLKNESLLSQHLYDRPTIRDMVRKLAKIDIGAGNSINYADYLIVKENLRRYNLSVEMYNKRHADEISAGILNKRYRKRFDILNNPLVTTQDIDAWVNRIKTTYQSARGYAQITRDQYMINFEKALNRRGVLTEAEKAEFLRMLDEHVKAGGDYFEIREYYTDTVILALQDVAEFYGFGAEWSEFYAKN